MFVEHLAATGLSPDHLVHVLADGAITASHVQNAFRLLLNGPVEHLDEHVVEHGKVPSMGPAAAPDIHLPIDMKFPAQLRRTLQKRRVAKNEVIQMPEC